MKNATNSAIRVSLVARGRDTDFKWAKFKNHKLKKLTTTMLLPLLSGTSVVSLLEERNKH
jgi:hypothetical protein